MAHITYTLSPHFTGQVGPVRFVKGHAETDDPELVEWFKARPDEFDVDDPREDQQDDPDTGEDDNTPED